MDLLGLDSTGNYDFPALCILGCHEDAYRMRRRQPPMVLMIMAYEYPLIIRNPKVNSGDWPLITAFQFPKPLMRDIEVS
jgi:hypothetical protein